jgi:6-phosphogluconolactonase
LEIVRLDPETAAPVTRPGCVGLRATTIARGEGYDASMLFFSAHTTTDDHATPYDQWLVVTGGNGWVSVGNEKRPVRAGDSIQLPRDRFHRFWTEESTMAAIVLTFEAVAGPGLVRVPDRAALAQNAAERFVLLAQQAIGKHGRFNVALSGGSTPRDLYSRLASPDLASRIDWSRVEAFWGDERGVPPDDPTSNYRMANETLLSRVPIPEQNIHRILAEQGPDQAAAKYEQTLRDLFRPADDELPHFDLILLGLGENGHAASLFPNSPVLREVKRWVVGYHVAAVQMDRITFTVPLINAAENILFLVAGEDKAPTVRAVLRGDLRPYYLPAQLIHPSAGRLVWLLDDGAATHL